jgi:hypothetical protein
MSEPIIRTTQVANLETNLGSAANTVRVSQNGSSTLSAKQLNFVNTTNVSITVSDSGNGNANISFQVSAGSSGPAESFHPFLLGL